jgi:hypothetical protein
MSHQALTKLKILKDDAIPKQFFILLVIFPSSSVIDVQKSVHSRVGLLSFYKSPAHRVRKGRTKLGACGSCL